LVVPEAAGQWGTPAELALPADAAAVQGPGTGLTGVSCAAAGDCTAVGYYVDTSGNYEPLAASETAGAWGAGMPIALPEGADAGGSSQSAGLASVACVAAGSCAAVGSYLDSAGDREPMVVTETNGSWTAPTALALPSNAIGAVSEYSPARAWSISCPGAGACVAVGNYEDAGGNLQPMAAQQ